MSFILETGLDLKNFLIFGLPFYAVVLFVVLVRKFLSADDDSLRRNRKIPMIASGILSVVLLIGSFGYWVTYDSASNLLAEILLLLWLILWYIFLFILYNLLFAMPSVEIIWFIVMLIKYLRTESDSDQKRDRKIEMFVSGGIAVIHILIVLVLTVIFQ